MNLRIRAIMKLVRWIGAFIGLLQKQADEAKEANNERPAK